ncbi:MAG: hypothetical protein Q8P54_03155 [bacterium]|nr:hypothetical protein [bacterium]
MATNPEEPSEDRPPEGNRPPEGMSENQKELADLAGESLPESSQPEEDTREQNVEKAQEMAEAQHSIQVMANNAEKMGNTELAEKLRQKVSEVDEEAGVRYEKGKEEVDRQVAEIADKMVDFWAKNPSFGESVVLFSTKMENDNQKEVISKVLSLLGVENDKILDFDKQAALIKAEGQSFVVKTEAGNNLSIANAGDDINNVEVKVYK